MVGDPNVLQKDKYWHQMLTEFSKMNVFTGETFTLLDKYQKPVKRNPIQYTDGKNQEQVENGYTENDAEETDEDTENDPKEDTQSFTLNEIQNPYTNTKNKEHQEIDIAVLEHATNNLNLQDALDNESNQHLDAHADTEDDPDTEYDPEGKLLDEYQKPDIINKEQQKINKVLLDIVELEHTMKNLKEEETEETENAKEDTEANEEKPK